MHKDTDLRVPLPHKLTFCPNRPTFNEILQTLDIWSAGGHGWPPVPLSSRLLPCKEQPRQQQQQPAQTRQQQQPPAQPGLQSPSPTQQQQQQQQGVVSPGQAASQQQQQQPVQRAASMRTAGTNGAQGRNIHMSWSEVELNEDYDS